MKKTFILLLSLLLFTIISELFQSYIFIPDQYSYNYDGPSLFWLCISNLIISFIQGGILYSLISGAYRKELSILIGVLMSLLFIYVSVTQPLEYGLFGYKIKPMVLSFFIAFKAAEFSWIYVLMKPIGIIFGIIGAHESEKETM